MKKLTLAFYLSITTMTVTAQEVQFGAGSCANWVTEERDNIFESMNQDSLGFFLWLGDNIYYRYQDWQNQESMQEAYMRRQSSPPLAQFIASTPQRAIWDDHDFGPNDSDSSFVGRKDALAVFENIWPETPLNTSKYGDIRWHELRSQTLFIGLDNRMHRGPVGSQMIGNSQLQYVDSLLSAHKNSPFVFIAIGSQVLNEAQVFENYSRFPEREKLLAICEKHPGRVIFLTGDRHHSEINESPSGLVEFCVSPLTSKCYAPKDKEVELNTNLIRESVISVPNYAVIQVFEDEMVVTITYKNALGEILLTHSIRSKFEL